MPNIKEQIEKSFYREFYPYTISTASDDYTICTTPNHVLIYSGKPYDTPQKLVLSYNLHSGKFGLYRDIKFGVFDTLCTILEKRISDFNKPFIKTKYDYVIEIYKSLNEGNFLTPEEKNTIPTHFHYDKDWDRYIYPNEHFTKLIDEIKGYGISIIDNVIVEFDGDRRYAYVPSFLSNQNFKLPNGEKVDIEHDKWKCDWFLVKKKFVGLSTPYYYHSDSPTKAKKYIMHPVDLEGNATEEDMWWYQLNKSSTRIHRYIVENDDVIIPEDFDLDKCEFHFYGKFFTDTDIRGYLNNPDCDCDRCRMYIKYKEVTGKWLRFNGYPLQYYKAKHILEKGKEPTPDDILYDCKCKGCKAVRKTQMFKDVRRKEYKEALEGLGWNKNRMWYLTGGFLANCKVRISKVPAYDGDVKTYDKAFELFDLHISKEIPKDYLDDAWYPKPLDNLPTDLSLADKMAISHCRCSNTKPSNLLEESNRWKKELFNTLLNPKCDCWVCRAIKKSEYIRKETFNELILEQVPAHSYPTGLFNRHFQYGWHIKIEEAIKYFNDYILQGKICECRNCQSAIEKMKNAQYLNQKEIDRPLCVKCGRPVHNHDLIYDSVEVAKIAKKQGFDDKIETKAGFCCTCYQGAMLDLRRKQQLEVAKAGTIILIQDEKLKSKWDSYPISNGDDGIKRISTYTIPEFLSSGKEFRFKSKEIEEKIYERVRKSNL